MNPENSGEAGLPSPGPVDFDQRSLEEVWVSLSGDDSILAWKLETFGRKSRRWEKFVMGFFANSSGLPLEPWL